MALTHSLRLVVSGRAVSVFCQQTLALESDVLQSIFSDSQALVPQATVTLRGTGKRHTDLGCHCLARTLKTSVRIETLLSLAGLFVPIVGEDF